MAPQRANTSSQGTSGRGAAPPIILAHVMTVSGSLNFIRNQPEYFRARGFALHVIASPGEGLTRFAVEHGISDHPIAMERRITPWRDLVSLWHMYRTFRKIRPHIVHTHTPKGGLLGNLGAWLARSPVRIYTIHGLPMMTATGFKRRLLYWAERISCWCAHRVLCVSPSIREVAIQEKLCPAGKIEVPGHGSSCGVDAVGRYNPARVASERERTRLRQGIPQEALVVGYVGRIVRDKGMVELARAWQMLRERFPELHLLLVGPFEPEDPLPQDVEALFRNDPRIHLTGVMWETPPYYAAMDVCVLPTYREGLPIVPLEAAAMCLPVVATRVPGCIDAVADDVTGLLVPPRNAPALAEGLARLLVSPLLRHQLGHAGRERVLSNFRPEGIWEALYEEYVGLLNDKGLCVPLAEAPDSREGRHAA